MIMIKKIILVLTTLIPIFLYKSSIVSAQVNYEDVIEKIHYTDPERNKGGNTKFIESTKEIGSKDPILKVYIFGDLYGMYTKKFFDETFDLLKDKYSQKVVFIYKHNPMMSRDENVQAGVVGECVARQGQFWNNLNLITNNLNRLENYASYLQNVDTSKIRECVNDSIIKSIVKTGNEDARFVGITGDPTFIIQNVKDLGGYSIKLNGAQDVFIFERALLEAENGDSNNQELKNLKNQVNDLQAEIKTIKSEQSLLSVVYSKIRGLFLSFFEKIAHFNK